MDIILKGDMDGIEASWRIQERDDIPVIFLTALADQDTLHKAQFTAPFGYITKPFEDQQLYSTIEIALYRHKMDKKLRENQQWLSTTLNSIGDAVITTDSNGLVTFLNPVAEVLTGWKQDEGINQHISIILRFVDEQTCLPIDPPVTSVLRDGNTFFLAENNLLVNIVSRSSLLYSAIKDGSLFIHYHWKIHQDVRGHQRHCVGQ
jgi:PAS domain-containing protein